MLGSMGGQNGRVYVEYVSLIVSYYSPLQAENILRLKSVPCQNGALSFQ